MGWEKVDYKGLWFHLPVRSGDFLTNPINHKKSVDSAALKLKKYYKMKKTGTKKGILNIF